jgi:hypothetical protein
MLTVPRAELAPDRVERFRHRHAKALVANEAPEMRDEELAKRPKRRSTATSVDW